MKKLFLMVALATIFSACGGNTNKKNNENEDSSPQTTNASGMKIITSQKFIKPEKVGDFIESTCDLIAKSRAEEGNISYTLYQDPSDSTRFIFFEEWKDQAAIDFHFTTDHFKAAGTAGDQFDASPSILKIFDAVQTNAE